MPTDTVTEQATILNESDPLSLLDRLPEAVFPIRLKIELPRRRSEDATDSTFRQPNYPVQLNHPQSAYIPETSVYFDNPVERVPEEKTAWRPREFAEQLSELLSHIDENTTADSERIVLSTAELAEVPSQYLTTDPETGAVVAKPDLYSRNAEVSIATLEKVGTLNATTVREDIEQALPGESRTPTRLAQVRQVTMKESRQGSHTTRSSSTTRYYTPADAEKVDTLSYTPAVYAVESNRTQGDRKRPLGPILGKLEEFFPMLMNQTELLETVRFSGKVEETEELRAREVQR